MRLNLALFALLAAAGCMSYHVQGYNRFDPAEKTITVGQGGGGLTGFIKARLHQAGWVLAVDRGPTVIQGTVGETTHLQTGSTFRSRYRMELHAQFDDFAIVGGSIYHYDISIVDNVQGLEILTMNGRGIDSTIADKLMAAITAQTGTK